MVERKIVMGLIKKYEDAWVKRDLDAIIKIFTKNGTYHERVLYLSFVGHSEIKKYWMDKVVVEQEDIRFKLLNLYIQGNTAIAE
jgi:ketosteroid isomerase-like protein